MQQDERSKIVVWIGFLVTAASIFCFSAATSDSSNGLSQSIVHCIAAHLGLPADGGSLELYNLLLRKAAHFSIFFVLGIFALRVFRSLRRRDYQQILFSLLLGIFFAIGDEFHQRFVSGRSPRILDVCIDTAGLTLGVLLTYLIVCRKQSKIVQAGKRK